ncbi:peptidoglycan-binding protein [Pedobacter ginsengisoli]|uniref:Peptidoglycan-binding protein n=1 Tax=Pedobacter ginsengisoli TaxID=363852 RepID=A0A2D1U1P1_9SPHI|nr:LysM peptidoglycan-binding domain-containing protein [Pedobacter ginsengisoli]ATP55515.1 peptidoglycan-binding protein [Pedobacter ginsengisoli]
MYKYYIVSIFAIFLSLTSAKANTRDSIGVENYNGKKLIVHKVVAKDTYYSIGRRYNVVPKYVMTFNDNKYLQIGVIIKVPTDIPFSANQNTTASTKETLAPTATDTPAEGNLIEHAVQKKENLNMLAEKYGTTVNEIKRVNNLRSINLQIGQLLKIPATKSPDGTPLETVDPEKINTPPVENTAKDPVAIVVKKDSIKPAQPIQKPAPVKPDTTKPDSAKQDNEPLLIHTVASNETMYSIATRYKLTMDQLKAKNNLTDNSLSVGQKLWIRGQYPVAPPEPEHPVDTLNSIKDPSLKYAASRYGLNQIDEKGTAVWISDNDLDPSKMLVLHRTAPIGTVMKITNPMSNRSTFAKVVGKFTENESTKDVIIVMTKAVADALGALDKRFYCNLTYGGQENEQ